MKSYIAVHVNSFGEEKEILAVSLSLDNLIDWLIVEEKYLPDNENVDIDEDMTFGRIDLSYGWVEIEVVKLV